MIIQPVRKPRPFPTDDPKNGGVYRSTTTSADKTEIIPRVLPKEPPSSTARSCASAPARCTWCRWTPRRAAASP